MHGPACKQGSKDPMPCQPAALAAPVAPLQVATPRVRSASKRAIPRLTDHVSKLACVGNATQVGVRGWEVIHACRGGNNAGLPLRSACHAAKPLHLLLRCAPQLRTITRSSSGRSCPPCLFRCDFVCRPSCATWGGLRWRRACRTCWSCPWPQPPLVRSRPMTLSSTHLTIQCIQYIFLPCHARLGSAVLPAGQDCCSWAGEGAGCKGCLPASLNGSLPAKPGRPRPSHCMACSCCVPVLLL
jgi:hypothetical protein